MDRYPRAFLLLFLTLPAIRPAGEYTVLDVQSVPLLGDPTAAVVHISLPDHVEEVSCDVLVAGAGMGGVAASMLLAERGRNVCLTEETDWVGGQATSGGVS